MGHTEALLLVHDQQPQIFESHVLRQQAVGTDDQVDIPGFQPSDDFPLLRSRTEAAQEIHPCARMPEALYDRVVVLLYENRCRCQHGYLLVVRDRLEGRPQADLRLAVSYVAAQQPVHVPIALHVLPDLTHALGLVRRQFPRELVLKLALPRTVRTESVPRVLRPFGIQCFQVKGKGFQSLFDLPLLPGPFAAAQPVQLRCLVRVADIALHPFQLFHRHIQLIVSSVKDQQVIVPAAFALDPRNPLINTDAVILMHHVIPHLQIREGGNPFSAVLPALAAPVAFAPDIRV